MALHDYNAVQKLSSLQGNEQSSYLKMLSEQVRRRLSTLKVSRSIIEEQWEEISEIVLPIKGGFTGDRVKYERNGKRRYDSTAALANDELGRQLSGLLTSQSFRWFSVKTKNKKLMANREVRMYLENEEEAIFDELATSNFYSQADELYTDLPALGTGIMFKDKIKGVGLSFKTLWLGDCYISEGAAGIIDTVYREFMVTPRVLAQEFGPLNLGKFLTERLVKNPEEEIRMVHAVFPRSDRQFMSLTKQNKKWASIYMVVNDGYILSEGGYDLFPFYVPRWRKRAGDPYGYGPAIIALADIRMLNNMSKTTLKAAQKVVSPPILYPNDSFLLPPNLRENGVNYFEPGTEDFMRPFPTSGNIPLGLELEDRRREIILRAFHADKLQLQKEKTEMTKAEAVIRNRENLRGMSPITSRIEREWHKILINDMITDRQTSGRAPEPPGILNGEDVTIEFVSPMARARKADEADSVFNTLNLASQLALIDPNVIDRLDADLMLQSSDDWFGLPNKYMRSDVDFAAVKKARAEQEAKAEMRENVETAATAAGAIGE